MTARRVRLVVLVAALLALFGFAGFAMTRFLRARSHLETATPPTDVDTSATAAARAHAQPGDAPSAVAPSGADDPVRVIVRDAMERPVPGADVAFFAVAVHEIAFDTNDARIYPDAEPPVAAARGRSGEDGVAIVRGVPRTRWSVIASAPDAALGAGMLPDVPAGTPREIVVHLAAGHRLRGRVFAPGGELAPGIAVVVAPTDMAQPWPTPGACKRTRTDAAGAWSVDGLVVGDHEIWTIDASGNAHTAGVVRVPLIEEFDVHLVRGAVVAGRVVDPKTGDPRGGVRVRLDGAEVQWDVHDHLGEGLTDAAGRFEIAAGESVSSVAGISLRSPGSPWIVVPSVDGLPAKGLADGMRVELVVPAPAGATLSGKVADPDGLPVAGATVDAWFGGDPAEDAPPDAKAVTGSDGAWSVSGAPTGGAKLLARAPGFVEYDDSTGVKDDDGRVEITLERAVRVHVSGQVVDPGDAPLAGAEIWVRNQSYHGERVDGQRLVAHTGADGAFRVEAVRTMSDFVVEARLPGRVTDADWTVDGGEERTDVKLVLREAPRLHGRVLDAGGAPISGARVALFGGTPAQEAYMLRWDTYRETVTGADGNWQLARDDDQDHLWAWSPEDGSVAHAALGKYDEVEYDLRTGPRPAVTGHVIVADSGAPAPGLRVLSTAWMSDFALLTWTGPDGSFRLEHAPGMGKFASTIHIEGDGFERTDVAAKDLAGDVRIEVRRLAAVAGGVVRDDGAGVQGVSVATGEDVGVHDVTTDADGRFRVDAAAGTEVALEVSAAHGNLAPVVVRAAAGARDVRIVLARGRRIAGIVRDARGQPIAEAEVSVTSTDEASKSSGETKTASDGTFVVEGLDGTPHTLSVFAPGRLIDERRIEPAGDRLQITLEDGRSISGVVLGPDGPVPGCDVDAQRPAEPYDSHLQTTRTDAEGRFRLTGLGSGTYWLHSHEWGVPDGSVLAEAGAKDVTIQCLPKPEAPKEDK